MFWKRIYCHFNDFSGIYSDDFVLLLFWMSLILSIHHRKCSCHRNLKLHLIFYFSLEAVIIHRFTAVDVWRCHNTLQPTLCVCINSLFNSHFNRDTPANDFPVLLRLKPPSVKIFCRSGWLTSKLGRSKEYRDIQRT